MDNSSYRKIYNDDSNIGKSHLKSYLKVQKADQLDER